MELNQILGIIGGISGFLGILFGVSQYNNRVKDDGKEEGINTSIVMERLGYVTSGIDDIKREQKELGNKISGNDIKMAAIETEMKQNSERIRKLEDFKDSISNYKKEE